MERENRIDFVVYGIIGTALAVGILVLAWENIRQTELLNAQVKELRVSMEEAGYVCREPRIEAAR